MNNIQFDMNVFDFLAQGASSFSTLVAIIGVIAAMFIMSVFVTKLGDMILPKPKETRVSDFLPFSRLDEDGATIHLRNGSLARVFEITGADTTLLTASERFALMNARKQWVDSMASLEIVSRVITIRERIALGEEGEHKDSKLLRQVSLKWSESMSRVFRNKHYIVLSVNDRKTAMDDLQQATIALTSILDAYQPVLISEKTPMKHKDKSPFWLFSQLASPLSVPRPRIGLEEGESLNALLTADYIHFTKDEGIIKFFSGDVEKYALCIGIRKPGDFMDEQMIADILSIDCEVTLVHNIKAIPMVKANMLLMQQRRMAWLTTFSTNVMAQYNTALEWMDQSDADGQTLNEYAMTIFVYGYSKNELKFGQEEIEKIKMELENQKEDEEDDLLEDEKEKEEQKKKKQQELENAKKKHEKTKSVIDSILEQPSNFWKTNEPSGFANSLLGTIIVPKSKEQRSAVAGGILFGIAKSKNKAFDNQESKSRQGLIAKIKEIQKEKSKEIVF